MRLDLPLLYLQAARDRLVGLAEERSVRTIAPGMRVERMDAPHFLLQVRPGESARAIADYVRNLYSGS